MAPTLRRTRPVRNGLTSTSEARATMSAPSATRMTGTPMRAVPSTASSQSAIVVPTMPPFPSSQVTNARKSPAQSRPSPSSS